MKNFVLLPVFFILFTIVPSAKAQKAWSLQECINYALTHNIQLKQTSLNTELTKAALLQSKAALLPSINASASSFYNFGRTIDPFTNTFAEEQVRSDRYSISGNFILFNGFQNYNTIAQNKIDYLASKYDFQKAQDDIALSIAAAYLQALFSRELLEVAQSQLALAMQQLERTKKLVEAGTLTKGNQLDIEAQLSTEELQVVNAENQLSISYLNLEQLLNLDSLEGFSIEKPLLSTLDSPLTETNAEEIYNIALSLQPSVKSSELKVKSAQKGIAIANGTISPTLILSGSYGTGYSGASKRLAGIEQTGVDTIGFTSSGEFVYTPSFSPLYELSPFADQINDNLNKTIGFSLSVPIFNKLESRTAIKRAKINRENAKYNLELTRQKLRKDIQQAYVDAQNAFKKYKASQKTLEALKESFTYAEQRFNVGLLDTFAYNEAKNKLTQASSELLQAKYDYIFKIKVLDYYQGKPLSL